MTTKAQYAQFGKAVAETLHQADGEPVFGRVLELDDEAIVRLVRRYAEDYGIPSLKPGACA